MNNDYQSADREQVEQTALLRSAIKQIVFSRDRTARLMGVLTIYRNKLNYEFNGMPYAEIRFESAVIKDRTGVKHPVDAAWVAELAEALLADEKQLGQNTLSGEVVNDTDKTTTFRAYEGVKIHVKGSVLYLVFGVARELVMRSSEEAVPRSLPPFPKL
ncbi:hypothetical protein [Curtobacterium flaccumfaciens]|uniref:hypothetical protein n=1 Tax=Curtobacterium flaccumfaciens TaxID=2035 RepID=UPI003879C08F